MAPDKSLEAVVWVAVGGRGTLIGPIIGAIVVNALKSWATRAFPDLWLIILGAMFVVVVLFLPKGIVSLPGKIFSLVKRTNGYLKNGSAPSEVAPELPLKESTTQTPSAIRTGRLE
jgi:hypothetical protein